MRKTSRPVSLCCLLTIGAACATAVEVADTPVADRPVADTSVASPPRDTPAGLVVDTHPVSAATLAPPTTTKLPKPFIGHEGCAARITLVRASPVLFEDDVIGGLREVELDVAGPVGLAVGIEGGWAPAPTWEAVQLPPKVALRLPAGPAVDGGSGFSGALFDLGGLAVAGFANLVTAPLSIPIALLTNSRELFFFDAPTFSDGMFNDIVLDEQTWQAEVARRAAPHKEALAVEAARQARFRAFLGPVQARATQPTCVVDDSGHCELRFSWPTDALAARFSGAPCTVVPVAVDEGDTSYAPLSDDDFNRFSAHLPALPTLPTPTLLPVPPNPAERRGHGAVATRDAWSVGVDDDMGDLDVAFGHAAVRGNRGVALHDVDLVCRVATRGNDFDVDGSAADLKLRLAWGFDHDVVGRSFGERSARVTLIAVPRASLEPGELVKLSLVDVDTFVDDWVGMDIVTFDGTLPLRFVHPSFTAECRGRRSSL